MVCLELGTRDMVCYASPGIVLIPLQRVILALASNCTGWLNLVSAEVSDVLGAG